MSHDHHHDHHGDHVHAHGVGHAHVHAPPGFDARTALLATLALNGAYLGVELGVGLWTGSLALLSDAAHMASDVSALVLALGASQLARWRASERMTYGLSRAEVLGAFVSAVLLLGVCGYIVVEAAERLRAGPPVVAGAPVLVVGAIGLLINLGSAWFLYRSDPGNLNIRGALLHMLADALGSAAAVIAAVALMFGVPAADPIASLVVAALVAWGAVSLLRDAGRILLELPPPNVDVARVRAALRGVEGVSSVHDLHVWSLDGRDPLVSAHLVVADGVPLDAPTARAHHVLDHEFGVHHATLQAERGDGCPTHCDA